MREQCWLDEYQLPQVLQFLHQCAEFYPGKSWLVHPFAEMRGGHSRNSSWVLNGVLRLHMEALCMFRWQSLPHWCRCLQGKPLVERLRGIGHLLGIGDEQRPQQEQLVGARLQGEAREALIAAMAVRPSALDDSSSA